MTVLSFPKRKPMRGNRRKPDCSAPHARVHVFPTARHLRMVLNIAAEMSKAGLHACGSPVDAAETALVEHLEVVWRHLQDLGVSELELEREIRSFAVAAWAAFGRQSDRSGAA